MTLSREGRVARPGPVLGPSWKVWMVRAVPGGSAVRGRAMSRMCTMSGSHDTCDTPAMEATWSHNHMVISYHIRLSPNLEYKIAFDLQQINSFNSYAVELEYISLKVLMNFEQKYIFKV